MLSFARTGDETFVEKIRQMKQDGATVTLVTTEDYAGPARVITRTATITWQTHNTEAAVL